MDSIVDNKPDEEIEGQTVISSHASYKTSLYHGGSREFSEDVAKENLLYLVVSNEGD